MQFVASKKHCTYDGQIGHKPQYHIASWGLTSYASVIALCSFDAAVPAPVSSLTAR